MSEIQTNLLGRLGTAEIWDGIKTPIEIVGAFLNTHNPKHPSVELVVQVTAPCQHTTTGDLHTVNAERCSVNSI